MRRRNAGASGRWRKSRGGKNNKARKTATDSSGRKLHLTEEKRRVKGQMRTVYVVSGFAKGKKEYYNAQNAYDRMARWEGDAGFKSKRYDREDSDWRKEREAARKSKVGRKKKSTREVKTFGKKVTSGKKPSAFAEAGESLRRLGYTGKLGIKSLDSLAKRKKKIKALRAKGRTMKAYEGVARANPRRRAAGAQMHYARRRNALYVPKRRNPEEILDMYLSEEDLY
jgi:hypothetical protein